jgi:predicted lactoylglutathione lyase
MQLGAFSISLAVKDIAASRAFYEKLGFAVAGGVQEQKWLIMRSDTTVIGLFEGMFEKNLLTFNPGWDAHAKPLAEFTDVRDIQKHLIAQGISVAKPVADGTSGPGSIMIKDPDGNDILIDQHV